MSNFRLRITQGTYARRINKGHTHHAGNLRPPDADEADENADRFAKSLDADGLPEVILTRLKPRTSPIPLPMP